MCRNIKTLYHLDPPATKEEVRDAAVDDVARAVQTLLDSLQTSAPPRRRQTSDRRY